MIVINGRVFDPKRCVRGEDLSGAEDGEHYCVHDWRCIWENLPRVAT